MLLPQNRRTFFSTMAAGAVAASVGVGRANAHIHDLSANHVKLANNVQASHGTIIGQGDFKYRVNRKWGDLNPETHKVLNCQGIEIDSRGRVIMVADGYNDNVFVYEKDGSFVESWQVSIPGAHAFRLSIENGEEFIYIVDNGWYEPRVKRPDGKMVKQTGAVHKMNMRGDVIYSISHPMTIGVYTPEMAFNPADIVIAPNGDLFVSDGYGSNYVLQYSSAGEYIRHFGGRENEVDPEGNLSGAHGISIDYRDPKNPLLLVNSRVQEAYKLFTLEGEFVRTVDTPGAMCGRGVFHGDYIYAPVTWSKVNKKRPVNSGFILVMDRDYKAVATLGGTPPEYVDGKLQPMKSTYDVFHHAHGLCLDEDGNIYVAQWNAERTYPIKLERV